MFVSTAPSWGPGGEFRVNSRKNVLSCHPVENGYPTRYYSSPVGPIPPGMAWISTGPVEYPGVVVLLPFRPVVVNSRGSRWCHDLHEDINEVVQERDDADEDKAVPAPPDSQPLVRVSFPHAAERCDVCIRICRVRERPDKRQSKGASTDPDCHDRVLGDR